MKKIMFNDRYGLTQAVLEGEKTMTRRIIQENYEDVKAYNANGDWHFIADTVFGDSVEIKPLYEIGEIIAIAQPYKHICLTDPIFFEGMRKEAGWSNKMFVCAKYMPHRIRITDIKVERLQDISNKEAMREGISRCVIKNGKKKSVQWAYFGEKITTWCLSPREAFAALIGRISGKGTWENNPWVYAYSFELLKR